VEEREKKRDKRMVDAGWTHVPRHQAPSTRPLPAMLVASDAGCGPRAKNGSKVMDGGRGLPHENFFSFLNFFWNKFQINIIIFFIFKSNTFDRVKVRDVIKTHCCAMHRHDTTCHIGLAIFTWKSLPRHCRWRGSTAASRHPNLRSKT